jgi:uncharacterized protein (DUF849 family)
VNLTSGGSPFMTIEERIQPSIRFKPELASLNMGSMNFGLFPLLNRFKDFKHEWERQYLESTRDEARDILHLKGADTVSF